MKNIADLPLVYRGSVKDIRAEDKENGPYYFEYSDRYSIFDWGEMPDQLHQKGQALAFMASFFFRKMRASDSWAHFELPDFVRGEIRGRLEKSAAFYDLKKEGLPHHAIALVGADLTALKNTEKSAILKVKKVPVIRPTVNGSTFDYSAYQKRPVEALVPLEVIFRLGLPQGSSLLERLKKQPEYAREIGVEGSPQIGEFLRRPLVEFSTKLEPTDRYMGFAETQKVAGLSETEFNYLYDLSLLCALKLSSLFAEIGVELWDGKFEFAFTPGASGTGGERRFQLVDSIGPDELRLLYKGTQLSKEVLRAAYRDSSWHRATSEAKELAKKEGSLEWKKICRERLKESPAPLAPEIRFWSQGIYTALANALAAKAGEAPWFKEAPDLDEVMNKLKALLGSGV